MPRNDPRHQRLVDAVVDAEDEAVKLVEQASSRGPAATDALKKLARKLVELKRAGKVTTERARELWRQAFIGASLASFAGSAQAILDSSEQASSEIADAAEALGPEVTQVEEVTKADFDERATTRAARAEGGNG